MGRLRDKPKTSLRRKLNLTLIRPNLTVCSESLYTIVTKSLPICIFFELQPGSESLVGIKVATWKMTEKEKKVLSNKTKELFPLRKSNKDSITS